MATIDDVLRTLVVAPGSPAHLTRRDPRWWPEPLLGPRGDDGKAAAAALLERSVQELAERQEQLWASGTHAVLLVLQAIDAAGKDGAVKHVFSGVNPQGVRITPFRAPSPTELDHDFLWRCVAALPARGQIGVFNRSYYEEVLVVRARPELLAAQHLPLDGPRGAALWKARYRSIVDFEHHLDRAGTRVVKVFLHLSREEQRERLLARLDDPAKHWKFDSDDLATRGLWDPIHDAYEAALTATSTDHAPWYVVPADRKPVARALVAALLVRELASLPLELPPLDAERRAELAAARAALEADAAADGTPR